MKQRRRRPSPAGERYAPVEKGVVAIAMAMIFLLAAAVCVLHAQNAVALRGTIRVGDCEMIEDGVSKLVSTPDAQVLEIDKGTDERFVTYVGPIWRNGGLLRVSGALLRLAEPVGEVRVRAGLVAVRLDEDGVPDGSLSPSDEVILLNTQMRRRTSLPMVYECDDHCGFEAAARTDALREGTVYELVLVDRADAGTRLFKTNCWLSCEGEKDLTWGYRSEPQEEVLTDE